MEAMPEQVIFEDWRSTSVALTAIGGLLMTWLLGHGAMPWLNHYCRQPLKAPSESVRRLRANKATTPTMGGLFVLAAWLLVVVATQWIAGRLSVDLGVAVGLVVGLAALGACDDWLKIHTSQAGMRPRTKLLVQGLLATAAVWGLQRYGHWQPQAGQLVVPLLQKTLVLGDWYGPFAVFMIVASSNAVNLTDGLDGLASGCLTLAFGAYAVVALFASIGADHLAVSANEAAVMAAAACGAMIGFLRFNRHPARVFMGDTGALPLGGLLAIVALLAKQELLLMIVGGVFLVETLSVILQVASYRLTGRRIFRCAPLHHHFQLRGWAESLTVRRFHIASAVCGFIGLAMFVSQQKHLVVPWQALVAGKTSHGTPVVHERFE